MTESFIISGELLGKISLLGAHGIKHAAEQQIKCYVNNSVTDNKGVKFEKYFITFLKNDSPISDILDTGNKLVEICEYDEKGEAKQINL